MGEFLIIMGLVVFYNLFKIIFNIIRIIFLKKKVKRFLKIDLISEIIYFLGWIDLMRNAIILVPRECTEFCVNSKYNIWYRMVVLSSCF